MREVGKVYDLVSIENRALLFSDDKSDSDKALELICDKSEELIEILKENKFYVSGFIRRREDTIPVSPAEYSINCSAPERVGNVENGRVYVYDCPLELENLLDGIVSGLD